MDDHRFGRSIAPWVGVCIVVGLLLVGGLSSDTGRAASFREAAGPSLTVSISVSPQPVSPGSSFTVTAMVSNGNGPFTFNWNNLPSGCNNPGNVSSWTCSLSSSGNYMVSVSVTNHTGAQGSASQSFSVSGSGNGNGGGNGSKGNGNGSNGNSSNGLNLSGLGPIVFYAFIAGVVGFVLLIALTVGVIMIAVILARRLPRPPRGGVVCPACHSTAPAGSKFCPQCGASLAPKS